MNNTSSFFYRYKLKMSSVYLIYLVVILSLVFWSLNRGILFTDESWYLLHLKGFKNSYISEWPVYGTYLFPSNLIALKIELIALYIISSIVCAFGMLKYLGVRSTVDYILIGIIGTFVFCSPVVFIPNYFTLNCIVFQFGTGLFFASLAEKKVNLKIFLFIITGFVFSQLIFILPSNLPFIFVLICAFIISKQSLKFSYLPLFLGSVLGMFFYFAMCPFDRYLSDMKFSFSSLAYDNYHGSNVMLLWFFNMGMYFIKIGIISAILWFAIYKKSFGKFLYYFSICTVSFFFIFDFYSNWIAYHNIESPSYLFVILFLLIGVAFKQKKKKELLALSLILAVPIFASLGTNVPFEIRASVYLSPVLLITYLLLKKEIHLKKIFQFLNLALLLTVGKYCYRGFFKEGWQRYVISEQCIPVTTIGINQPIKLDETRINQLKELKNNIPEKSFVLSNNSEFWGPIYLLNLCPPFLYFHFNEKQYLWFMKNRLKPNVEFLMEDKTNPFPKSVYAGAQKIDTIPLLFNPKMNLYKVTF
jgi:hypothetical protein